MGLPRSDAGPHGMFAGNAKEQDVRRLKMPVAALPSVSAPDREPRSWRHLRADAVKSARERADEKRQEKLANVAEMVQRGSLVIRKMTEEERRRYPPRPVAPRRFPGR
jgi:hypothetical protein